MSSQLRFLLSVNLVILFIVAGCKKEPAEIPVNNFVHFPIGKKAINDSNIFVEADSIIQDYSIYHDAYGGKWLKIAFNKLNKNSVVRLRFIVKAGPLVFLPQPDPIPEIWQTPCQYIDADHPAIIEKANHLTNGIEGVNNKAKNIQLFVWNYLDFVIYKDCGLVWASATLQNHYGMCINYARLFVALCRAAGIPARSVWGCLYNGYSFQGHHNWAEFIDEDGHWHALDFSFTTAFDLNDIRYLDLLYAPEQNPYIQDYHAYIISANGDYFFYDGSANAVDGKLNVSVVSDYFPDSLELLMSYPVSKMFED